jgi:TolA-binding protein
MSQPNKAVPRYGMMVTPEKSASLMGGQWDFPGYTEGSYIGQCNKVRVQALAVAKRLNDLNAELALAKATGKSPKIPDSTARVALVKRDREQVDQLKKAFDDIEGKIFELEVTLQPYSYTESVRDATISAQLRGQLLTADDKARAELLQIPAYRRAAFEAPAQASGIGKMTYDRLRGEDIARRYPDEVKTIADFRKAEDIVSHVFRAVDAGLSNEMIASGAAPVESAKDNEPPAQEAWA